MRSAWGPLAARYQQLWKTCYERLTLLRRRTLQPQTPHEAPRTTNTTLGLEVLRLITARPGSRATLYGGRKKGPAVDGGWDPLRWPMAEANRRIGQLLKYCA